MDASFRTRPGDHVFFRTMAIASSVAIAGGFLNTYGPKVLQGGTGVHPIVHLHAGVFVSWLVLFIVQTTLVSQGRVSLHKRIGTASVALAATMLVLGVATAIVVTSDGHRGIPGVEFPTPAGFLLLNLGAIVTFTILFAAAWYFRHDIQIHKRLMLTAVTGSLVGPGVSRLPVASGNTGVITGLVLVFLFAGPVYDFVTRRRVHVAYWWGAALSLSVAPPAVQAIAATASWQAIAEWLWR